MGWSGGADLALAAAGSLSDAVEAVAPVEPVMPPLMDEEQQAALRNAVTGMGGLAAEGRLTDAARAFAGFPFTDEDIAVAEDAGYFEAAGRYVPNLLNLFQQQMDYQGPGPEDPAVLGAISAPVLVLLGSDSKSYASAAARHVLDHVSNARIQEIPNAGHASPLTHAEELGKCLAEFFTTAQQPA